MLNLLTLVLRTSIISVLTLKVNAQTTSTGILTLEGQEYNAQCKCGGSIPDEVDDLICDPNSSELIVRYGPPREDIKTQIDSTLIGAVGRDPTSVISSNIRCTDGRSTENAIYYPGGSLGIILTMINILEQSFETVELDAAKLRQLLIDLSPMLTAQVDGKDHSYKITFCTDSARSDALGLESNYDLPNKQEIPNLLNELSDFRNMGNFWWRSVLKNPELLTFSRNSALPSRLLKVFHILLWEHDTISNLNVDINVTNSSFSSSENEALNKIKNTELLSDVVIEAKNNDSCNQLGLYVPLNEKELNSSAIIHTDASIYFRHLLAEKLLNLLNIDDAKMKPGDLLAKESIQTALIMSTIIEMEEGAKKYKAINQEKKITIFEQIFV